MKREKWQKHLDFDHSLLHLMRAIARAHAITLATNLKRPKKTRSTSVYDSYFWDNRKKKLKKRSKTLN